MSAQVLLCVDTFILQYPQSLGFPPYALEGEDWLVVRTDGAGARGYVDDHPEVDEVWVVGCDDINPINLAAAIKADCLFRPQGNTDCAVYLVTDDIGDVAMRAQSANLDGMLTASRLVQRFYQRKQSPGTGNDMSADTATIDVPPAEASFASGEQSGYVQELLNDEFQEMPGGAACARVSGMKTQAQAMLLPVVSAQGGTGRSTVAVLCALWAARAGKRTLLIDADLQFGDVAELLGMTRAAGKTGKLGLVRMDEVLDGSADVDRLADLSSTPAGKYRLAVLGAMRNAERAESAVEQFGTVLDAALRAYEVVVVNTASWWTEVQATLLDHAAHVLYVLDQQPTTMRVAKKALTLCEHCGMATGSFLFLLNRCSRGALYSMGDVQASLGEVKAQELRDGGVELEELMATGRADELFVAYNAAAQDISQLMMTFFPESAPDCPDEGQDRPHAGIRGLLGLCRRRPAAGEGGAACPF